MLSHPVSKYPLVVQFSMENPLPKTPRGLADGLLDVATILCACATDSPNWDDLSISMSYRGAPERYPGAFLSNPSFLPNTTSHGPHGSSYGSLTAGCFFSYAHYQEDSLGTALLLPAFSPRTQKAKRSIGLYAQALQLLLKEGHLSKAGLRIDSQQNLLDQAANDPKQFAKTNRAWLEMSFDKNCLSLMNHLRTDLAPKAIRLALTDTKTGLFTEITRDRLDSLACAREAAMEAREIEQATAISTPSTPSRRARI